MVNPINTTIPTVTFRAFQPATNELQDRICTICQSVFDQTNTDLVAHDGMHIFHRDCLRLWFSQRAGCPLCDHPGGLLEEEVGDTFLGTEHNPAVLAPITNDLAAEIREQMLHPDFEDLYEDLPIDRWNQDMEINGMQINAPRIVDIHASDNELVEAFITFFEEIRERQGDPIDPNVRQSLNPEARAEIAQLVRRCNGDLLPAIDSIT